MVSHIAIQRILWIGIILIILTSILWENWIIDTLSIVEERLQICLCITRKDWLYTLRWVIDFLQQVIFLHKHRKSELAFCRCFTGITTLTRRKLVLARSQSLLHFFAFIFDITHQVGQLRCLQSLHEERKAILLSQRLHIIRQCKVGLFQHMINSVQHAIAHSIIGLNNLRLAIEEIHRHTITNFSI